MIDWLLGLCNPTYDWLSLCNNWQMDVCTWLEDSRKRLSPDIKASFRIERKIHNYKIFTKTYANKSSPFGMLHKQAVTKFYHPIPRMSSFRAIYVSKSQDHIFICRDFLVYVDRFPLLLFSSVYISRYIRQSPPLVGVMPQISEQCITSWNFQHMYS